jgi:hypothetical protein
MTCQHLSNRKLIRAERVSESATAQATVVQAPFADQSPAD